jgi:hypothetical protein
VSWLGDERALSAFFFFFFAFDAVVCHVMWSAWPVIDVGVFSLFSTTR